MASTREPKEARQRKTRSIKEATRRTRKKAGPAE